MIISTFSPLTLGIIASALVSLVSLVGIIVLILNKKILQNFTLLLVSLAAGTLIGDTFIHIIPEIFKVPSHSPILSLILISGILIFFFLEKAIHWHHCQNHSKDEQKQSKHLSPIAINNLLTDGLHNFIDGLVIGASFMISTEIGIATTTAVILHEIPQEIGDFGVLIHSGLETWKALFFNFMTALLAILGVLSVFIFGTPSNDVTTALLAFAGGGFLYIALSDLIPELKSENNLRVSIIQLFIVISGVLLMYILTFIE